MYKELLSANKVGITIDTNKWMMGVRYSRNIIMSGGSKRRAALLEIGFFCLISYIAMEMRENNELPNYF